MDNLLGLPPGRPIFFYGGEIVLLLKLKNISFRLSAVFAVFAVLFCLIVPANAYGLDPIKYVESYKPNGSYDLIDVVLPLDKAWIYTFYDSTQQSAKPVTIHSDDLIFGWTYIRPGVNVDNCSVRMPLLGVSGTGEQYLDVSQVPTGSTFSFNFGYIFSIPEGAEFFVQTFFYDSDMQQIGSARSRQLEYIDNRWTASTTSGKPEGAVGARFTLYCNFVANGSSAFGYGFKESSVFHVSFNIPSYVWNDSTEKNNALLGSLDKGQQDLIDQNDTIIDQNQQIIDKNDTIIDQNQEIIDKNDTIIDQNQELIDKNDEIIDQNDQIINGTVAPDSPDGADRIEDLDDSEAGLRNDAQEGLNEGMNLVNNAFTYIKQYTTAFYCVGAIFNCFAGIPIFTALLCISLALGTFGLFVNLAHEVNRATKAKSKTGYNRATKVKSKTGNKGG